MFKVYRRGLILLLISSLILTVAPVYGTDGTIEECKKSSDLVPVLYSGGDLVGTLAAVGDKDSEGYIFRGSYNYEYGMVASVTAFAAVLVSRGASVLEAAEIANAGFGFGSAFFYSKNDQWTKTDSQYIYVKTIVKVYERLSGNNYKLGSYTRKQKRALNGTVWIDIEDETI